MLQVADLVGLPKGQAFALLEGGRLWKIRLPLATPENDEHMPANIAAISDYIKGIRSRKRSEQENENDLTIEGESHYGW